LEGVRRNEPERERGMTFSGRKGFPSHGKKGIVIPRKVVDNALELGKGGGGGCTYRVTTGVVIHPNTEKGNQKVRDSDASGSRTPVPFCGCHGTYHDGNALLRNRSKNRTSDNPPRKKSAT